MKKMLLIIACFISLNAVAQKSPGFRINGYAGYVFNDKIDYYYSPTSYYNGQLNGAFLWGVGFEYMIKEVYGLELLYTRQDTKAPIEYWNNGLKRTDFNVDVNNILLGGVRYFPTNNQAIEPYTGIHLGVGIVNGENPENGNSASVTKFAWQFKAGTNIWASDRFGFKVQGAFGSIVQGFGGSIYFGTGGGGVGVSGYSSVFQFSLSGGLVVKLGGN